MSFLDHQFTILAQLSKWQRLGDGLRSRGRLEFSEVLPYLIGLVAMVATVLAAVTVMKRYDMSKPCDDPGKLFRELCQAHQLDFASRRLLRQLAEALGLKHTAEIFCMPDAFERSQIPQQLRSEQARIQALGKRLF